MFYNRLRLSYYYCKINHNTHLQSFFSSSFILPHSRLLVNCDYLLLHTSFICYISLRWISCQVLMCDFFYFIFLKINVCSVRKLLIFRHYSLASSHVPCFPTALLQDNLSSLTWGRRQERVEGRFMNFCQSHYFLQVYVQSEEIYISQSKYVSTSLPFSSIHY